MSRELRVVGGLLGLLAAGIALSTQLDAPARGWLVLAVVVAANVALPLAARAVGRDDWVTVWAVLLPVSVLQVLPDWVLAGLVGTLEFDPIGGPRLGDTITLAMAGLWVVPLAVAVIGADGRPGRAAGLALGIFAGAELLAPTIGIWEPTGRASEVAGVALYVLPAEAVLGAAAALAVAADRSATSTGIRRLGRRAAVAGLVSAAYTGSAVTAYFLIDVASFTVTV
ncbi:hypothetical protein GKE82_01540 [Conexibacter sp. W3-3-2]|uniref:DUF6989 domain-containing protein n=1 Tax=Conexibacter sp. W3-3-2 TaxID=2675227 RepID=UPI0012BA121B|nr:hypothetical protein [Conexibacter sp. W3-3-2]MTD43021.1 hypothetical protein [Conexibacter sp. W3-3-2]